MDKNGIANTDAEVSNKLVLQAHESFKDFPEEEFRFLAERYLALLFNKATKSKKNVKMSVLRAEALTVCVLGLFSAKIVNKDFRKIKKAEELISVIHQATGIEAINIWLKSEKRDAEAILEASGVSRFYKDLCNLSFTDQTTHLLKSLDDFHRTVAEVFDWLKLVKSLNSRRSINGVNNKYVNDFFKFSTWDKNKIYYTFIIGITMETGNSVFSLNDLLKFSLIIQNKNWVSDFESKLKISSEGNELIDGIHNNATFKNIIDSLKQKKNQNLAYFVRKVNIVRGDYKLMNDFIRVIDQSLIYVKQQLHYESVSNEVTRKNDLKKVKNKLGSVTRKYKAEGVYKILIERPYLIYWFSREEIARVLIFDSKNNNELQSKIEEYTSDEDLKEILEVLNSNESVPNVLHMLMTDEKIFGFPFSFFVENRSEKLILPINSVQSYKLLKNIINLLGKEVSFKQFSLWLAEIDEKNSVISLDGINVAKLAAHLFLLEKGKVSRNVLAVLSKQQWYQFLTPEIISSIKERIK